jgi:hypothetical protein
VGFHAFAFAPFAFLFAFAFALFRFPSAFFAFVDLAVGIRLGRRRGWLSDGRSFVSRGRRALLLCMALRRRSALGGRRSAGLRGALRCALGGCASRRVRGFRSVLRRDVRRRRRAFRGLLGSGGALRRRAAFRGVLGGGALRRRAGGGRRGRCFARFAGGPRDGFGRRRAGGRRRGAQLRRARLRLRVIRVGRRRRYVRKQERAAGQDDDECPAPARATRGRFAGSTGHPQACADLPVPAALSRACARACSSVAKIANTLSMPESSKIRSTVALGHTIASPASS